MVITSLLSFPYGCFYPPSGKVIFVSQNFLSTWLLFLVPFLIQRQLEFVYYFFGTSDILAIKVPLTLRNLQKKFAEKIETAYSVLNRRRPYKSRK